MRFVCVTQITWPRGFCKRPNFYRCNLPLRTTSLKRRETNKRITQFHPFPVLHSRYIHPKHKDLQYARANISCFSERSFFDASKPSVKGEGGPDTSNNRFVSASNMNIILSRFCLDRLFHILKRLAKLEIGIEIFWLPKMQGKMQSKGQFQV